MDPLLAIARQYSSPAEFKAKNLPKYLVAKKRRLLAVIFPPQVVEDKALKGIYVLYKGLRVVYVNYSLVDCIASIESHSESTIDYDSYKIYTPSSDSDIIVLATYLTNRYRPRHNNNIGKQPLSFRIPDVMTLLGQPLNSKNDIKA